MDILICALHRPTKPTGVCRHAVNLALCLAESNAVEKVTLLIGIWQKHYFETSFDISSQKIQTVCIDIDNSSLARNFWYLFGLPTWANRLKVNLVHLSFPLPFLRQLFRVPVVATIHDLYPYEKPENFGYPNVLFNQMFLKQCINSSDALACVSKTTLQELENYFYKASKQKIVSAIYNYVDLEATVPEIPHNELVSADQPFLLCVAQHRKNKNLDLLITAYHKLLHSHHVPTGTQLIIVGNDGPETQALKQLCQGLSLDRVYFLSSLADSELCWLYQNCLAFVIASTTEGFCIPLIEALVSGSRVVCSDIPIFREVGTADCVYFDLTLEPEIHLAQAIAHSLSQPAGKHEKIDAFSKAAATQSYLRFYTEVLTKG